MPLKDLSTIEGTKTVLETKISVQDIGTVKWYHNDRLLTASDRVQMVVKGAKQRLVLARTHASDEGHYKLMVSRAETSCRLSVQGKNNYGSCRHDGSGFRGRGQLASVQCLLQTPTEAGVTGLTRR